MKFPHRKSRSQRLLESVSGLLDVPGALKPSRRHRIAAALPNPIKTAGAIKPGAASNPIAERLPQGNARATGLVASGVAGLTLGSAGISALRRRKEGAGEHS